MIIQLIDHNKEMCDQWKTHFNDCNDVTIHCGDYFALKTDCVVSPANSFGFMDGGLDFQISEKIGWHLQDELQLQIIEKYDGELLVGQAILMETKNENSPFIIAAPTMRVPEPIENSVNIYLATKAILRLLKQESRIKTVSISGLGTGVGKVAYAVCAKQMKQAYNDVWRNQFTFPNSWQEAKSKNEFMLINNK
jgi:O-acetyl-ADP-ribose deacetylase (regulator of RNase III)